MYTHEGGCHCGNMRWTLTSRLAAAQLPVRACQCTFCRKQGAPGSSDPAGTLRFAVRDPAALLRYRLPTRPAHFLLCARCGVYGGAVRAEGGRRYGVVKLNSFEARPAPPGTPPAMGHYDE